MAVKIYPKIEEKTKNRKKKVIGLATAVAVGGTTQPPSHTHLRGVLQPPSIIGVVASDPFFTEWWS